MGGCASAPARESEQKEVANTADTQTLAEPVSNANGRTKSLDSARTSAEVCKQETAGSSVAATFNGASPRQRAASLEVQSSCSALASSGRDVLRQSSFSKPPLAPSRNSFPGPLLPPSRSTPTDGALQSPSPTDGTPGVSKVCSRISEDGSASSAFASASAVGSDEGVGGVGRLVSLQAAKSVPEQMLLGHSPPLHRAQTLFTGAGAPRAARTTVPAATSSTASSKGLEQAPEPNIDHILGLAMSVFRTDSVLLHLRDGDQVFARGGDELFAPGIRSAACRLLEPADTGHSAVEDVVADVRVKDRPDVAEQVKFFAATPLVAANGYRLGSLCLIHSKPQKFDLNMKVIIGSMADLMVREIWGAYEHAHKQRILQLIRVVDCYSEPLLFVEASQTQPWRVLHLNDAAISTTGLEKSGATGKPFWDVFKGVEESNAVKLESVSQESSCGQEFTLQSMQASDAEKSTAVPFTLVFRPAAMEAVSAEEDGEEATVERKQRPVTNAGRHYYFVALRLEADAAVTSAAERLPFVGLQLGLLLGKGAYGRVYKGYYHGKVVAVKVCDSDKVRRNKEGVPIEVDVTAHLVHPNLVRTIESATAFKDRPQKVDWEVKQDSEAAQTASPSAQKQDPQASAQPIEETWLLLEYCDQGCFIDAVLAGWFRTGPDKPVNAAMVLATAGEIASGMAFLHSRGIVHGDLSSGNVLLTSCATSAHGFCAKVSDFGLARDMDLTSCVETKTTGTVTHMPPEVLSDGLVTKAADVYAFGVLLWEMLSGERAWYKQTPAQVVLQVAFQNNSLQLPLIPLPELSRLGQRCLNFDRDARPTFQEILREVKALQSRVRGSAGSDDRMTLGPRALSCPQ